MAKHSVNYFFLLITLLAALPSFSQSLRFEQTIKGIAGPENFNTPSDVKVDLDGNIYVVANEKIKIFTNDGSFIRDIGIPGPENEQFFNIKMEVDADKNVYVVDRQIGINDSIKIFDSHGNFLLKFTTLIAGEAESTSIQTIATHSNEEIYLADNQNSVVKVFSSSGEFLRKIEIGFSFYDMALDTEGNIYLTSMYGISIYSNTGSLIKEFGLEGIDDGQAPSYGGGITVSANGNIYVGDSGNFRVLVFDSNGNFIYQFGSKGGGDGQFSNSIRGLTVDQNENTYVVDVWRSDIQIFDNSGTFKNKIGSWPEFKPLGLAFANEKLFITDYQNPKFLVFAKDGSFLKSQGNYGDGEGQFQNIVGIAAASNNNIYIIDQGNNRVQIFNSTGEFINSFGSEGTGDGEFSSPFGITIDKNYNVYVADLLNNRVQVFTSSGTFLRKFGSFGTGDGQFNGPTGIALDSAGNIYVSDTRNHRVQVFTNSGTYLRQFGSFGSEDGKFNMTEGLKVDKNGIIYVVDRKNHRIQLFTNDGIFISKFGSLGSEENQFNNPWDIVLDDEGKMYIADANNFRIQVLALKPFSEISFSPQTFTYGQVFDLRATSTSSGTPSFNIVPDVSNTAEIVLSGIENKTVTIVKPGTIKLRASFDEDATYSKSSKEAVLTILKSDQTISMEEIADHINTAFPFEITATSTSGLPVTFSITNGMSIASITNSTISLTKTIGAVTVEANQPGNENYNPATPVSRSFSIHLDPILGLEQNNDGFFVGPNPATNTLLIHSSENEKIIRIQMVDIFGRLIKEVLINNSETQVNLPIEENINELVIVKVYTNSGIRSSKILFRKIN